MKELYTKPVSEVSEFRAADVVLTASAGGIEPISPDDPE